MKTHLHSVERATKRTPTGVPGIGYFVRTKPNRKDTRVPCRYFATNVIRPNGKRRIMRFRIETLGLQEAWRRALKARAEFELRRHAEVSAAPAQPKRASHLRRGRAGVPTTPARKEPAGVPDATTSRTRPTTTQAQPA